MAEKNNNHLVIPTLQELNRGSDPAQLAEVGYPVPDQYLPEPAAEPVPSVEESRRSARAALDAAGVQWPHEPTRNNALGAPVVYNAHLAKIPPKKKPFKKSA